MTSDITTGTLTTSGTTTFISGTASKLDTASLIQNAVDANNTKADTIDVKISENEDVIAAFEEYYGLANALQSSLTNLKSYTSLSSESTNAFEQRTASLTSTGAEATGLIDVGLEENAPTGTYQIVVNQKAEAFSIASTNITDKDAALGYTGSFDIGIDGFSASSITVGAGDSLQDIADSINANTAASGVAASILKVSETEYQLVLTGTQTNQAMSVTTSSGNVLQNLGIVDGADTFQAAQVIQNEQGSEVTLNGTTITRDDNNYDDLIDGINIDIRAADPASTITIDVNNEAAGAKEEILAFIDAFNTYREFVIQNQEVSADGTLPEDAKLFSETTLENLSNSIFNILTTPKDQNENITNLSQLGITFDANNRLVLEDESLLDDALLNNFDEVKNFFTTNIETSDTSLRIISNTSTQANLDFNLDITVNPDGSVSSAFANGVAFEIDGGSITGPEGSVYEGLTFAYIGGVNTSISVSIGAGIADQIYNAIEGYTNPVDGLIQNEIEALTSQNDELSEEAAEIRERGEEIRERQITKYAALEAALLRAESLKSTLAALLGNDDD